MQSRASQDTPDFPDVLHKYHLERGNVSMMKLQRMGMSNLIWSIKNGELQYVKLEMELREIPADQMVKGRRLLHYAAESGQSEIVRYLLELGADKDVRDEEGVTPLQIAMQKGKMNCVEVLLDKDTSSK